MERPALVLISTRPHLGLLLAKNVTLGETTVLHGVRWVRIPAGWRLMLIKWIDRIRPPARLPDEWLFNEVALECHRGLHVANIAPDLAGGLFLPSPSRVHFPLKHLTHAQFDRLSQRNGRLLLAQTQAMFPQLIKSTGQENFRRHPWLAARTFAG